MTYSIPDEYLESMSRTSQEFEDFQGEEVDWPQRFDADSVQMEVQVDSTAIYELHTKVLQAYARALAKTPKSLGGGLEVKELAREVQESPTIDGVVSIIDKLEKNKNARKVLDLDEMRSRLYSTCSGFGRDKAVTVACGVIGRNLRKVLSNCIKRYQLQKSVPLETISGPLDEMDVFIYQVPEENPRGLAFVTKVDEIGDVFELNMRVKLNEYRIPVNLGYSEHGDRELVAVHRYEPEVGQKLYLRGHGTETFSIDLR